MSDFRHQPYYCEENVWWLCQHERFAGSVRHVVFISNEAKTCAFAEQRVAGPGRITVWDYHVILRVDGDVWDLDSLLPTPTPWGDYLRATFPPLAPADAHFAPQFRAIEADAFVARFATDRRHMRDPAGAPLQPPPDWTAPAAPGHEHNLASFVSMRPAAAPDDPAHGSHVMDLAAALAWAPSACTSP